MITAEQFEAAVGHPPKDDDLDRCNCDKPGHMGHWACGWDARRGMPHFIPGTAKNARYYNNVNAQWYEKVFLTGITCRNHSTILFADGRERVVHNSELMNPFSRVQTLHHPHIEEISTCPSSA